MQSSIGGIANLPDSICHLTFVSFMHIYETKYVFVNLVRKKNWFKIVSYDVRQFDLEKSMLDWAVRVLHWSSICLTVWTWSLLCFIFLMYKMVWFHCHCDLPWVVFVLFCVLNLGYLLKWRVAVHTNLACWIFLTNLLDFEWRFILCSLR